MLNKKILGCYFFALFLNAQVFACLNLLRGTMGHLPNSPDELFSLAPERLQEFGKRFNPQVPGKPFSLEPSNYSEAEVRVLQVAQKAFFDFSEFGKWIHQLRPDYQHLSDPGLKNASLLSLRGIAEAVFFKLRKQGYEKIVFADKFEIPKVFFEKFIKPNDPFVDIVVNLPKVDRLTGFDLGTSPNLEINGANYSEYLRAQRFIAHGPISHIVQRAYLTDYLLKQGLDPKVFFSLATRDLFHWEKLLDREPTDISAGMANPGFMWAILNLGLRWPLLSYVPKEGHLMVAEGSIGPMEFGPMNVDLLHSFDPWDQLEKVHIESQEYLRKTLKDQSANELKKFKERFVKSDYELKLNDPTLAKGFAEFVRLLVDFDVAYRLALQNDLDREFFINFATHLIGGPFFQGAIDFRNRSAYANLQKFLILLKEDPLFPKRSEVEKLISSIPKH